MSDNIGFEELYKIVAQLVYLGAICAALVYGVIFLAVNQKYLKTFLTTSSLYLLLPIIFLTGGAILFFFLAVGLEQVHSFEMFVGLGFVLFLNIVIGTTCLPAALINGKPSIKKPWKANELYSFCALLVVTLGWSFLSIQLVSLAFNVDLEIPDDSFVNFISTERLAEYMSFACFALMGAFVEEIIFRGAIQGGLEKTFLGKWGALIITSIIFALGHAGYITPHGIKEIHTFGLGVLFGLTKNYFGIHMAVLLHFINNFLAVGLEFIFPTNL